MSLTWEMLNPPLWLREPQVGAYSAILTENDMSPIKKSTQWAEYFGSLGRPLYVPLSKGSTRVGLNIWQPSNCGSLDGRARTNKIHFNMWKSDNLQNSTHLHIRQINSRVANITWSVNCHISLLRMLYLWRKLTVVNSWKETWRNLRPQHCPCYSLKLRGWPQPPCGHWRQNWKRHISSTKHDPINVHTLPCQKEFDELSWKAWMALKAL